MWTKSFNIEVIVICFLSLIPWPGPSVFKISCSRENTRVVRKIVQSKWLPILEKYQVKLPLECPFHPLRDIFGPQQSAKKQNRPSQWTCGFCGKSFFEEKFLDIHFEARHRTKINMAEDAVCLADYCDIMRCEVLLAQDSTLSFGDSSLMSTDIEVWSESTAYRTALSPSGPRDLAKLPLRGIFMAATGKTSSSSSTPHSSTNTYPTTAASSSTNTQSTATHSKNLKSSKDRSGCSTTTTTTTTTQNDQKFSDDQRNSNIEQGSGEISDDKIGAKSEKETSKSNKEPNNGDNDDSDSNKTTPCDKDLVDSALPPVDRKQQRLHELQRLKANCRSEDLDKIKIRCEILVRDCIAGLLIQLAEPDFKEMEDELNRAVCWYLTCDRYWEDGPPEQRSFPWALVFILVMVLSLGVCFCYYIIWVLFDSGSDDHNLYSMSTQVTAHSSPTHTRHHSTASSNYHHLQHHSQPLMPSIQHHLHHQTSASSSNLPVGVINQISPLGAVGVPGTSGQLQHGHSSNSLGRSISTEQQQQQHHHHQQQIPIGFADEFYANPADLADMGQSEHYIYVTYPPELKRRLLESCYNRTTRL